MTDGEDLARDYQVPLEVLHDEDDGVAEQVLPSFSPYILALNNKGVIMYCGHYEEIELWELMDKLDVE